MGSKKYYKPGQIITIGDLRYRITKYCGGYGHFCKDCDLRIFRLNAARYICTCMRYCCRAHNDWNKNPNGYYLEKID